MTCTMIKHLGNAYMQPPFDWLSDENGRVLSDLAQTYVSLRLDEIIFVMKITIVLSKSARAIQATRVNTY